MSEQIRIERRKRQRQQEYTQQATPQEAVTAQAHYDEQMQAIDDWQEAADKVLDFIDLALAIGVISIEVAA